MADVATEARGFVRGLLPAPLADQITLVVSLGDLLTSLEQTERTADAVRVRLNVLYAADALSAADHQTYNRMRRALYRAQWELWKELERHVPGAIAGEIPSPRMMPPLGVNVASIGGGIASGVSGRLGIGTPAAAAPAAPLAAAPWMWAALVVAILVALGLLVVIAVAIATSAAAVATVGIASRYAELAEQLTAAREAVYRQCVTDGGTPEDCAAIARTLVPTPAEQIPDIPNPLDGMSATLKWGAIGIGVALAGFFGWKLLGRKKEA